MAVGGVDGDDVYLAADQFLGPFEKITGRANGGAHAQAALFVLGRVGVLQFLLNVLDRDQALERVVVVHHQQFLNAVSVQNAFGVFKRGADGNGDEPVAALRHPRRDRQMEIGFKAQVAIGEDADQMAALGRHRNAGDAELLHQFERVGDGLVGADGDGIDNHAALGALHAVDLLHLPFERHVAVNDADAALLGEGDGKVRLRHRVHGGADDRNLQRNPAGQQGAGVGLPGQNVAVRRLQENVVKSEAFLNLIGNHVSLQDSW